MNTALQCLVSLSELTRIFTAQQHLKHTNKNNKFGYGGRVADLFHTFINNYANNCFVRIDSFKNSYTAITSKFGDSEEQDCFEFLMYLLDDLHEDLKFECGDYERICGAGMGCSVDGDKKIKSCEVDEKNENVVVDENENIVVVKVDVDVKGKNIIDNINGKNVFDNIKDENAIDDDFKDKNTVVNINNNNTIINKTIHQRYNKIYFNNYNYLCKNTSLINVLFTSELKSTAFCLRCGYKNVNYEVMNSLTLFLPPFFVKLHFDRDEKHVFFPCGAVTVGGLEEEMRSVYPLKKLLFVENRKVLAKSDRVSALTSVHEYDGRHEYVLVYLCTKEYVFLNKFLKTCFYVRRDNLKERISRRINSYCKTKFKIKIKECVLVCVEEWVEKEVGVEDLIDVLERRESVTVGCHCGKGGSKTENKKVEIYEPESVVCENASEKTIDLNNSMYTVFSEFSSSEKSNLNDDVKNIDGVKMNSEKISGDVKKNDGDEVIDNLNNIDNKVIDNSNNIGNKVNDNEVIDKKTINNNLIGNTIDNDTNIEEYIFNSSNLAAQFKTTQITGLPFYLIIHLNRLNTYNGRKNCLFVDFGDKLVLKGVQYRLVAVSNHHEIGVDSGHYTANVVRNGKWWCVNDLCVSEIEPGHVFIKQFNIK